MRYRSCLLIALCIVGLQACKHPLAIEGEGDIIEVSGGTRGCTLEQYRERVPACAENLVTGDYQVTYRAVPRPGWVFVRWQGPCSPRSAFQHCSFNVSATTVDWWDDTYPDVTIAPTTAIFEPGTGETGYLVAGAPVAGVAYQTTSRQGVTGLDGSFRYEAGESIRFRIGATILGEVDGQAQVTPFDLADSPVITGTPDITSVLERDGSRFNAAVNIAVFLHSLDHDANPDNGIEISQGVADLFRHTNLRVRQHWKTFREDRELRRAFSRAIGAKLFGTAHGVANPAPVMQALYDDLGIDAQTLAISSQHEPGQETIGFRYYSGGNLGRVAAPEWYREGDDSTHYFIQKYLYDDRGNQTRFEERRYEEFEGSISGEDPIRFRDLSVEIERRHYNAMGDVTRITRNRGRYSEVTDPDDPRLPIDISLERSAVWRFEYGPVAELLRVAVSYGPNGEFDNIATYQYDANGRLIAIDMEGDRIPAVAIELGIPSMDLLGLADYHEATYRVIFEYDANGNLTSDIRHGNRPDFGQRTEIWHYNSDGNVARFEGSNTLFGDPPQQGTDVHEFEYDTHGNLIREAIDRDGDHIPDVISSWHYDYDNQGNAIREESVVVTDGIAEQIVVREYDQRGNIIREDRDANGDGDWEESTVREYDDEGYLLREVDSGAEVNYQYKATGWGHIFHSLPDRNLE